MALENENQLPGGGTDVSLLRLVESSGVLLTHEGKVWVGSCPFHADTDNSLMVDPETNHWQCDGECQTGGSVIEWVMKSKHVSHSHAVELLRHDHPIEVAQGNTTNRSTVRVLDAPFKETDDDQPILQQVLSYYHETLKKSPEALATLKRRGIDKPEAIEHFGLGFSNRTLGYHLPEKNRKPGAAMRGRLQRLGMLKPNGHENFRGCVVIPIINDGVIKHIYGRKIAAKLRPGTPKHCHLSDVPQGVLNLEAIQVSDEIILCQSIIDALTFWCAGHRNVTCVYGLDGFTTDFLSVLERYAVKRVLIAFVATKEADDVASNIADQLTAVGIDAYRIEFPRRLDANAYALKAKPTGTNLDRVIRKAVWLGKGQEPNIQPSVNNESVDEVVCSPASEDPEANKNSRIQDKDEQPDPEEPTDEISLPASVVPAPSVDIDADVKENEIVLILGDLRYRVRGLNNNLSYDVLKLNVLVSRTDALHVDTFDLYSSKHRNAFIRQSAIELNIDEDVIKKDLGKILLKLEILQDKNIQHVLTPKQEERVLSKKDNDDAMALLRSPNLMQRLLDDYERCGVVGEKTNKLVGYLSALSRKLEKPLAVIIQSTSAAGKSALMDAVLSFVPDEDRVQYSAMTGQSLFYMGDINLKHKILAINEEEGASKATYALKLLQSEGHLTIASTGKDPNSGRHVTQEYRVEGPVMIFSTTTAIDIDEELLNRCLVLTVDEDRAQTQAIHDYQRYEETLEGLLATQNRDDIIRVHCNSQRLIKPLKVVNPYAKKLTFMDDKTRTRRDHKKYLTLMRSIALLHQYQRDIKTTYFKGELLQYVEVSLDDIDMANRIAHDVLGRTLDEMSPQTRRLLLLVDTMVTEHCLTSHISRNDFRFGRREIREYTRWGNTQLKVHLQRLEAMEYLLIHRGGRGKRIVYELLYNSEGQDGTPFMTGLIDVDSLRTNTCADGNEKQSGQSELLSETCRPQVGGVSGTSRNLGNLLSLNNNNQLAAGSPESDQSNV